MTEINITFIGGGNMASSIIGGLIQQGFAPTSITVADPYLPSLEKLHKDYGINTTQNNADAVAAAEVVVLAVKPQVMQSVAQALSASLSHQPLIVSIAAGIDMASLDTWLGNQLPIVRCMPNTPALVQLGATGLFANEQVSQDQRQLADQILRAVGIVQWLDDEPQLDAVTAVSGSGPAYYFLFMEAMIEAGVAQGLSRESATELTLQTALGAAQLAQNSDVDVVELRRRVTSPNGTTEQAILSFEENGLRELVAKAMLACAERSQTMAQELGAAQS